LDGAKMQKRRVVVTGLGCVTPLGNEVDTFWNNLLQKKNGISKITKFNADGYRCQIAGQVKNFDPTVSIAKKDIAKFDLFTQYAIVAAEQAVQSAKLSFETEDKTRIATILGSGMGGMNEVNSQFEASKELGVDRASPYLIPKTMVNAIAGEISIRYHLQGPSYVVASACASSSQAILCALRSIQSGESDLVISGGAEALITPLCVSGFSSIRALSLRNNEPERASRPFDKQRDGFVIGEGSGILILEERERAIARGANIYAEILGGAANCDGHHITSPEPEAKSITQVMKMAIQDSGILPTDIAYINAHGTSTKPNDKIETLGIKKVFGQYASQIPISSTKSMIGHLIGAAGAVEAIVSVLSTFHDCVHPTANYENPDPDCDLDYITTETRKIPVKYVLSNSFGFGGHNVCLVFGKSLPR
jgi:3-oxoacyl-[acyl-carrier-protein] synthase II